ncbi:MAG: hypothetical protein HC803_07700 [Saprospiraceae bacterium]|nr:hypothetical protein [Saprospiraceae bacterium]
MPNYWTKVLLLGLFLSFTAISFAQNAPKENSPYSRYGLGTILPTDFAASQSMGGLSAAYTNPFQLNITNPASLASLRYTSFETGAFAQYSVLAKDADRTTNWSGNLSHFALGFPLKNPINQQTELKRSPYDIGMALGLVPYSLVGYDMQSTSNVSGLGDVTYKYLGSGGTYQAFVSSGIKYKGFSVGGHLGYLFGNTTNEKSVYFNDIDYAFSDVFRDEYNINGLTWRLGVQYELIIGKTPEDDIKTLAERPRLVIGAYGNTANNVDITSRSIAARTNSFYTGSNLDTILSSVQLEDRMTLPTELGIGLTYYKLLNYKFGVDLKIAQWSQYDNPLKEETLGNSWRLGFGGEYIPDVRSYNSFAKQVRYRGGFYLGKDPRIIDGKQLSTMGLTLGVGLPLRLPRGMPSFVNLGLEAGQLSAPDLLKENYFKINVGFTLNDNTWFYKQKFN